MKSIFLGRPIHWLFALIVIAGGWQLGEMRLHVREFNSFLIILLAATLVLLVLVLSTSREGEAVTRDPVPEPGETEE